jgi:FAD/FMN-containing dehydrogenase
VVEATRVVPIYWWHEMPELVTFDVPMLPYGYGYSYEDSRLNKGGMVLDVSHLRRLRTLTSRMQMDEKRKSVYCL